MNFEMNRYTVFTRHSKENRTFIIETGLIAEMNC